MNKLKKYREDLHQMPELSLKELKTAEYIRNNIQKMGYRFESVLGTDTLVYLDNACLETIAFRSDIDALPIQEETELGFKSTNGFMHACGHDGHMAMLLGLADWLKDKQKLLKKNILLIFQPAEESIGGARLLVEKGIMQRFNVKKIFGIHLFPEIAEGVIASKPKEFMAMASEIDIIIHGKSAHGAMPQKGIDANIIASKLLLEFQNIQTRNISPMESTIITFGKISGGSVRNVISDYAKMEGTIRAFSEETFELIINKMKNIFAAYEMMYGCKIELIMNPGYLPVINDPDLYQIFKRAVEVLPYIELEKPLMIAEDFSFYQREVPGVFFYIGTRNEELGYVNSLHSSKFNFDEKVLETGLKAYQLLINELEVL